MLTKPDWVWDNCWCDRCHQRLNKLPKDNELVLVSDGLGKYYVFDSWHCAVEHCHEGKLFEGCGQHDSEVMVKFEAAFRRKPGWHISRTSILILQQTVRKLYPEEEFNNKNARRKSAIKNW